MNSNAETYTLDDAHTDDCPVDAYTACCKRDGFGAQFDAMMSVYAYTRKSSKPYCTSPWSKMGHGAIGEQMFLFVGGDFYGPPANRETSKLQRAPRPFARWQWNDTREFFINAYFRRPKPGLKFFNLNKTNYVWHIRRDDVSMEKHQNRYMPNSDIVRGIKTLQEHHKNLSTITFFSQGNISQFTEIIDYCQASHLHCPFILDGDADAETAFHHMVMADYLIRANSCFSGTASMINNKTTYVDFRLMEGICEPDQAWNKNPPRQHRRKSSRRQHRRFIYSKKSKQEKHQDPWAWAKNDEDFDEL